MSLACDVTGFYPPDISVRWLRVKENESEEDITDGAELWGPLQTLPRTFRAKALLKDLREMAREAEIVCRVMHCSLLKPIHRVWRNTRYVKQQIYQFIYLFIYIFMHCSLLKLIHRVWRNTRIRKTTDLSVYLLIYLYLCTAPCRSPSTESGETLVYVKQQIY